MRQAIVDVGSDMDLRHVLVVLAWVLRALRALPALPALTSQACTGWAMVLREICGNTPHLYKAVLALEWWPCIKVL
jgi:hypothetical protein